MATTVLAVAAVVGAGAAVYGASKQGDAIEEAAKSTENWQKYLVALEEKKYGDAKRFRDLAYEEASARFGAWQEMLPAMQKMLPLLQQDLMAEPGTSPTFRTAMRRGTESIMENLAPYGLTKSSVTGKAIGELGEGLLAQDYQNLINNRFRLAGFGAGSADTGAGQMAANLEGLANQLLGYAGQAQGDYASLLGAGGAVQGGMYGAIGNTASQLPMLYYMMQNQQSPNIYNNTQSGPGW